MKLSLAWIFDHINVPLQSVDVEALIAKFNRVTAEIEGHEVLDLNWDRFAIGSVVSHEKGILTLSVLEFDTTLSLPFEGEADYGDLGQEACCLLIKDGNDWRLATYQDFGQERPGPISIMRLGKDFHAGQWRKYVDQKDVIIDVDNKSLTHRPDMWGHRGFAREIAAFMDYSLIDDPYRTIQLSSLEGLKAAEHKVTIEAPDACSRFVALSIDDFAHQPSDFFMATRLLRLGARLISGVVDATNYLMLDCSQPVHVYDADKVADKHLIVRYAKNGETLDLLGDQTVTLTSSDLVIASSQEILGLAGIKGGACSGVTSKTTSIIFEAATFDAPTIRRTAFRLGVRTDASARFEKTLSHKQPREAVETFLSLADHAQLKFATKHKLVDVGRAYEDDLVIQVDHDFIEARIGISLDDGVVEKLLKPLEFEVVTQESSSGRVYLITVPHFRASKDISRSEDIVEEIARTYGFEKIPLELPSFIMPPSDITPLLRERTLRSYFAHSCQMIEQKNYMYFDKPFMQKIGLSVPDVLQIKNPVSENFSSLVTSLIPGLLKNIFDNASGHDDLRFFERARTWSAPGTAVVEHDRLCGIVFGKRSENGGFVAIKEMVHGFCRALSIKATPEWVRSESFDEWDEQQSRVSMMLEGRYVGAIGMIKPDLYRSLGGISGQAWYFDLDAALLIDHLKEAVQAALISRFQANYFDISLFIEPSVEQASLEQKLKGSDQLVKDVVLIDRFTKKEWGGKQSLTFRVMVENPERTMTGDELEQLLKVAQQAVAIRGVEVR